MAPQYPMSLPLTLHIFLGLDFWHPARARTSCDFWLALTLFPMKGYWVGRTEASGQWVQSSRPMPQEASRHLKWPENGLWVRLVPHLGTK